jgi:hypothetical protein
LNKEFLRDYAAREIEYDNKLSELSLRDRRGVVEEYKTRFRHLQEPVAWSHGHMSIWPQIPLYGTLIVPLYPFAETYTRAGKGKQERFEPFSRVHGFNPSDVDQLVDFARNTGRVAFVLANSPKDYEGLDFLDLIFSELRPPRNYHLLSKPSLSSPELERLVHSEIEFDTLARIRYYRFLEMLSLSEAKNAVGPYDSGREMIDGPFTYAVLDILGYHDLTNLIAEALVDNPPRAVGLLHLYTELILGPRIQMLEAIHNVNLGMFTDPVGPAIGELEVNESNEAGGRPQSYEIGKYLMTKLTPYPVGFEACRVMCDRFRHNDLHHVMSALQTAVKSEDYSSIEAETKQLSEILDNLWDDAQSIQRKAKMIRAGIPLSIAALGGVAAGPIGAISGGVLAKLGYEILDKFIEIKTDSISEKIAKFSSPNYVVSIFDFKKKYNTT